MRVEAVVRERLIVAADRIDEPWESAMHDVMARVSIQKRNLFLSRAAAAAGAVGITWLVFASGAPAAHDRVRPEPASSPATRSDRDLVPPPRVEPKVRWDRGRELDASGKGASTVSRRQVRGPAPKASDQEIRHKDTTADRPGGSDARSSLTMTRTYDEEYQASPVNTEIDRRSGCSLTSDDCAWVDVTPEEGTFEVKVRDYAHRVVLVRISQWADGTTVTDPVYRCSDTSNRFTLHPQTENLEISVEDGRCPDGRDVHSWTGHIRVVFYEGSRPS